MVATNFASCVPPGFHAGQTWAAAAMPSPAYAAGKLPSKAKLLTGLRPFGCSMP